MLTPKEYPMSSIPIVTIKDWSDYRDSFVHGGFYEYIHATQNMTAEIDAILKRSKDFKELKENLDSFNKERKTFTDHAKKHAQPHR